MTSADDAFAGTPPILKPYSQDANAPGPRRMRLLVTLLVAGFCLIYGFVFALFAPALMLPLMAPLPIGGLICIWALPDLRRAPTQSLMVMVFAFMVGLVMWPNYIAFAPPGLPWITMVRLTGFPMVVILLVCVSVSEDFRRQVGSALNTAPVIWKMLLAFVFLQVLSIAFSRQKGVSLEKVIVAQLSWTAMFYASVYVFLTPKRVERMAAMLWAMAIAVGVIGIYEWKHARVPWADHIPSFLKIPDPAALHALVSHVRAADGVYRTQSTFTTSLGLAEYVALILPFVVQFAFGAYRWPIKTAAALSIPFLLFIVFITDSRLGVVGCMMTLFLYTLIWAVLRWRRDKQSLLAPAVLSAYPMALAFTGFLTLTWPRLHNMVLGGGAAQYSTMARQMQWKMAMPKLITHPWGYGASMAGDAVGFMSLSGVQTLDSYFITIAMDYGVIGFIIFYGFLAYSVYYGAKLTIKDNGRALNLSRDYTFLIPMSIAICNFFVIKSVFSQPDNHPIIFMYMGMIVALGARIKQDEENGAGEGAVLPRGASAGSRSGNLAVRGRRKPSVGVA